MLKSPEQYLSSLNFIAEDADKDHLDAGERAFVEKYLGLDALQALPEVEPEAVPLPELEKPESKPQLMLAERQIVVAPAPALPDQAEVRSAPVIEIAISPEQIVEQLATQTVTVQQVMAETIQPTEQPELTLAPEKAEAPTDVAESAATQTPVEVEVPLEIETATETEVNNETEVEYPVAGETAIKVAVPAAAETEIGIDAPVAAKAKVEIETPVAQAQETTLAPAVKPETALREKWRKAAEIQMVSFLVAGQIFLLPVEGICEVVRHMELIKVPQAPEFVAGAINLRGHVMPVVYLSALLTNEAIEAYKEDNFIIITGTGKLRLGLIIDRVKSMHMVPQNKIIWNPESKLAEAAEFLNAIVDLDDHVCGMVAPETITRLIMPELD